MKYVLIFEKEELKDKKYFILKEVSLCKEENEDVIVLTGSHKGEIISHVSDDNLDFIQGDVMSIEELFSYYDTNDFDFIMKDLSCSVDVAFVFNNDGELVPCSEVLYVYDKVSDKIVGQDEQIKNIISVIYGNQVLSNSLISNEQKKVNKRNMVIMGKTGTGKSTIIKEIKNNIDLPLCITTLSNEDKGADLLKIIVGLLNDADNNIELASKGVVVVEDLSDEERYMVVGDAILPSGKLDFNYLLDAGVINIEVNEEEASFDLSNVSFIFLVNTENRRINDKMMGFENKTKETNNSLNRYFKDDTISRITDLVILNDLDKEIYTKILLESSISPLLTKLEKFKEIDINITFDMDFISFLADRACEINQGVFGLIKAVNEVFKDYEFDLITDNSCDIEFKGKTLVRK